MSAYDLRTYHVVEGQLATLERVLREVALPLMADHDMAPVGFWADVATNRLLQITRHDDADAVSGNWDRLHADPRWQEGLHAIRQDRSAVRSVTTTLLEGIAGLPPHHQETQHEP